MCKLPGQITLCSRCCSLLSWDCRIIFCLINFPRDPGKCSYMILLSVTQTLYFQVRGLEHRLRFSMCGNFFAKKQPDKQSVKLSLLWVPKVVILLFSEMTENCANCRINAECILKLSHAYLHTVFSIFCSLQLQHI